MFSLFVTLLNEANGLKVNVNSEEYMAQWFQENELVIYKSPQHCRVLNSNIFELFICSVCTRVQTLVQM